MSHIPTRPDRRRPMLSGAVAVAAVLAVIAVVYSAFSATAPRTASPSATSPASDTTAADAAGAFTARTLTGDTVAVPGSKPSVLFFFSVGCGSCGPGAQQLAAAQQQTPQANYVAVDVAPQETARDIERFLTYNNAASLAYTSDTDARLTNAFRVSQFSTAVVLDASGQVVYRAVEPTAEQIQTALDKAEVS